MAEFKYRVSISDAVLLATMLDDKIGQEPALSDYSDLPAHVIWDPVGTKRLNSTLAICTLQGLRLLRDEIEGAPVMCVFAGCGGLQASRERRACNILIKRISKVIEELTEP